VRTLTVVGNGTAKAVPDTAVLRISALHRATTLADALAGAESARAEVLRAAGDLVVSTVNLSVWPFNEAQKRSGFEARHSLTIATGEIASANELVARLATEVGDRFQLEGVDLTVSDPSAAQTQAREAAFADAREKAGHLAALADATLGQVEAVAEGGTVGVPMLGVATMGKADVGIQPGETSVAAALTVTWGLL